MFSWNQRKLARRKLIRKQVIVALSLSHGSWNLVIFFFPLNLPNLPLRLVGEQTEDQKQIAQSLVQSDEWVESRARAA